MTGFIVAGEVVAFDADGQPHFTADQLRACEEATRLGLAKWAATPHGRKTIRRFATAEYRVIVVESDSESAVGRAPQPGLATFLVASDHQKVKTYTLILNPRFEPRFEPAEGSKITAASFAPRLPRSPADVMAAAWAAEMLHIEFYANGIQLPHHWRNDFQDEWRTIAAELGFPDLPHQDDVAAGLDGTPPPMRIERWRK